ncbi:uncharacterized protein PFB0765w-like [Teleopsis dalmanni]|uniref:uncharacterized protein PFB0765w-like n=1 Tax=Teleopsis dalmanni TaxID=139649 RepID=UPI0018CDA4B7|nr:uncharacterized protein PFB0765w-like [Teleopsis dalmanni]
MYAQIRDEHIHLLRQHGETNKILNTERQNNSLLQNELTENKVLIRDMECKLNVVEKLKKQNSLLETNIADSINKYDSLLIENKKLKTDHLQLKIFQESKLSDQIKETENLKLTLKDLNESFLKESEEQEKENTVLKSQINSKLDEIKKIQEKCEFEVNHKETELFNIKKSLQNCIIQLKEKEQEYKSLMNYKDSIELRYNNLNLSNEACKERVIKAESELEITKSNRETDNKRHKMMFMSLISSILETNRFLLNTKFDESYEEPFNKSIAACNEIIETLDKLDNITTQHCIDDSHLGELALKYTSIACNSIVLHEKCILISKTSTDILHIEGNIEIINLLCL